MDLVTTTFSALREQMLGFVAPSNSSQERREQARAPLPSGKPTGRIITKRKAKNTRTKALETYGGRLLKALNAAMGDTPDEDDFLFNSDDDGDKTGAGLKLIIPRVTPGRSSVPATPNSERSMKTTPSSSSPAPDSPMSIESTTDEGDPTLSKAEQTKKFLDIEAEGAEKHPDITKRSHPDWSQDEIDLYNKLNNRGYEPLIPKHWKLDFRTVPLGLFSSQDDICLITSLSNNHFRAARALIQLFHLGPRVRDRLISNHRPEPTMTRVINAYIKWSQEDAGLNKRNPIPILAVCTAEKREKVASVFDRLEAELRHMGTRYRDEFRVVPTTETDKNDDNDSEEDEDMQDDDGKSGLAGRFKLELKSLEEFDPPLPTLYGLHIAHTVVSLVSYDVSGENKPVRCLALYDFSDPTQDVWNSLALAMICCWVREYLVDLNWAEVPAEKETDEDL